MDTDEQNQLRTAIESVVKSGIPLDLEYYDHNFVITQTAKKVNEKLFPRGFHVEVVEPKYLDVYYIKSIAPLARLELGSKALNFPKDIKPAMAVAISPVITSILDAVADLTEN